MKITYLYNGVQYTSEIISFRDEITGVDRYKQKTNTFYTVLHDGKEIEIPENSVISITSSYS